MNPSYQSQDIESNSPNDAVDAIDEGLDQEKANEESIDVRRSPGNRRSLYKKLAVGLVLVSFIVFVVVDSLTNKYVKQGIDIFLQWIENNPIPGVFAFMGVYFVATVLFIPGSILTLGSGFIFANALGLGFGVLLATIAVFAGASAGAIVAFLLGRYLLRDWVQTLTEKYPTFKAVDSALEHNGFRIMSLLRLSPIIPFNALNYIAGITAISLMAYVWSLIAMLPGTILYVFLGATAGSLADSSNSGDNSTVRIVSIVVGVVFGVLGVAAVSYYAKKELNKVIAAQEEETVDDDANNEIEQGEQQI